MAAVCGLYCGNCSNYLAPREGDIQKLRQISEERDMTLEEIRCDGCLSDRNAFAPVVKCPRGIRECAEGHGITWCFECDTKELRIRGS